MLKGDSDLFQTYGLELAKAAEEAIPGWVRRSVEQFLTVEPLSDSGHTASALATEVDSAGREAAAEVGARIRELLVRDLDDQWTNPLSILRSASIYPTRVLAAHSVTPVERDRHAQRIHPDDVYDLMPGSFSDFGLEVHDCGIRWGAAKAHLHLQRRRQQ